MTDCATQPEEIYIHPIEQIFINGEFVTPHGTEWFDLVQPGDGAGHRRVFVWRMRLTRERAMPGGGESCVSGVVADHKAGTPRGAKRMHAAVAARHDDLLEAVIEEVQRARLALGVDGVIRRR